MFKDNNDVLTNRLNWPDTLKGVAIVLVVLYHSLFSVEYLFKSIEQNEVYYFIHDFISWIHIPLFFFVSGFFLEKSLDKGFRNSIKNKFKSLYLPYLIWSFIFGIFYLILSSMPGLITNQLSTNEFLLSPLKPFTFLWFLYALFFSSTLFLGLKKVLKSSQVFVISLILLFLSPYIAFLPFNAGVSANFIYLVLGSIIFKKIQNSNLHSMKAVFILLAVNFISINSILNFFHFEEIFSNDVLLTVLTIIIKAVGILSGILAITFLCITLEKKDKIFSYLGRNSLYIYLLHPIFVVASRFIEIKIFDMNNLVLLIATMAISGIIFPIIARKILEKMSLRRVLFGR